MSKYVVIVDHWKGWRYRARIHRGTVESYYPWSTVASFIRPTARWAKAAGDRWIRRDEKQRARQAKRERRAQEVTRGEKR